jgi:hypothetical protein
LLDDRLDVRVVGLGERSADYYGSNACERGLKVRCAASTVSHRWRDDVSGASGIATPLDVEPDGERGPGSPRGVTDVTAA